MEASGILENVEPTLNTDLFFWQVRTMVQKLLSLYRCAARRRSAGTIKLLLFETVYDTRIINNFQCAPILPRGNAMPVYVWEGKNRNNQIQKGELEASSEDAVRSH